VQIEIFTVIVTYNGAQWIQRCLSSVVNDSRVVVIDNGSVDDTLKIIKSEFKNVHLMESKENLGFGAANNIGIELALKRGADYVFLLNQDAWIQKEGLKKLINTANGFPQFGILSPIHLNGTGEKLDKNFGGYLYNKGGRKFITDKICSRISDQIVDCEFVNAAAWLLSRKCIEKVGLFDSLFFHYGEDENYAQRVRYHNMKIGVVDSAYVHHDREGNSNAYFKSDFESLIRKLKIAWADVNADEERIQLSIVNQVNRKRISALKSLLRLDFIDFREDLKDSKDLYKIGMASLASRTKNRNSWKV
jgi:GT2 family glycosyltransferase